MFIEAKNLTIKYGDRLIHKDASFHIKEGEIYGFLGGSGSGKTAKEKSTCLIKSYGLLI